MSARWLATAAALVVAAARPAVATAGSCTVTLVTPPGIDSNSQVTLVGASSFIGGQREW